MLLQVIRQNFAQKQHNIFIHNRWYNHINQSRIEFHISHPRVFINCSSWANVSLTCSLSCPSGNCSNVSSFNRSMACNMQSLGSNNDFLEWRNDKLYRGKGHKFNVLQDKYEKYPDLQTWTHLLVVVLSPIFVFRIVVEANATRIEKLQGKFVIELCRDQVLCKAQSFRDRGPLFLLAIINLCARISTNIVVKEKCVSPFFIWIK